MEILASQFCSASGSSVADVFYLPEWQLFSFMALVISLGILSAIYMFNRLFGNEQGEGWVKIELFELLSTLFIVVIIIGILDAACVLPVDSLGVGVGDAMEGMNVFDAAAQTLSDFSWVLTYTMTGLHTFYIPFDFMTTQTMTAQPLGLGTVIQPTAGMGAVIKPGYVNALQMMGVAFILIRAQLLLLDFATFALIKYYLPLGILLRCFAPTRRIGGTLMGLVLGTVLVLPCLIVLNGMFAESFTSATNPFGLSEPFEFLASLLGKGLSSAWGEMWSGFSGALGSGAGAFTPLSLFQIPIAAASSVVGLFAGIYAFLFMWAAGQAFLIGLFFPALNTLLLVTTIRYLTRAFGEEIDVTNLTRMI